MSEYVPTIEEVREALAGGHVSVEEFNRWLRKHEAAMLDALADEMEGTALPEWVHNPMMKPYVVCTQIDAGMLRQRAKEILEEVKTE